MVGNPQLEPEIGMISVLSPRVVAEKEQEKNSNHITFSELCVGWDIRHNLSSCSMIYVSRVFRSNGKPEFVSFSLTAILKNFESENSEYLVKKSG